MRLMAGSAARWRAGNKNRAPQGPVSTRGWDRSHPAGHIGMFCCATMQYSMPIENMVLNRLA